MQSFIFRRMNNQRGTNMPHAIEQCDSKRKPALKIGRQFNMLVMAISLGLPGLFLSTAYSQSVSGATQQGSGAKAQIAYSPRADAVNGARLPDLSSLDIPLL